MVPFSNCSILCVIITLFSLSNITTNHAARSVLQLPNLSTIPSITSLPTVPTANRPLPSLPTFSSVPKMTLPPMPANIPLTTCHHFRTFPQIQHFHICVVVSFWVG
ncbi:hypothetical protein R3W88_022734 [Solanum pinnatisectum]|uniref:Uncharacterized protein n=1 Tax=Solanum pinnatisectum TaxID=50273 RepID=A0AAV9LVF9_9SOLN|nr:hypothetical protein R3W88_022734 [Solanum pinnatisectum]